MISRMTGPRDVLVLWGQGFDEWVATTFVCELRRLGMRVRLVGINRRQVIGRYGLALTPDQTLEQTLGRVLLTRGMVLPCEPVCLQEFSHDPRLAELLQAVTTLQVPVVVGADTASASRVVTHTVATPSVDDPYNTLLNTVRPSNLLTTSDLTNRSSHPTPGSEGAMPLAPSPLIYPAREALLDFIAHTLVPALDI